MVVRERGGPGHTQGMGCEVGILGILALNLEDSWAVCLPFGCTLGEGIHRVNAILDTIAPSWAVG